MSWKAIDSDRTISELFSNPNTRAKMLKVAADYERMAHTADERDGGGGDSDELASVHAHKKL